MKNINQWCTESTMSSVVLTLKTCYMYIERCIDVLHVHHTMDNRRDCIPLLRLESVTSDIRLSMLSNGQLFSTVISNQ